mmetsp:Transcript_3317/g.5218  ORF Transcript_3317/g.5218 Transcript_3317/m.5218 type:complete len:186 (+) Transcript_3317:346-903(+)
MVIAPYAVFQQRQLTDIESLQATHDRMHSEVSRLHEENLRLKNNVEELEGTVMRLEDVEGAINMLTETQGLSVQEFSKQVEDNRQILAKMQNNLKTSVLQNLLTVIMRCDTDGDFTVKEEELEGLLKRLKSITGVRVREESFRNLVAQSNGNIDAVMEMIKDVMDADNPNGKQNENPIFELDQSS